VPLQQALAAVGACQAPPGRMEVFGGGTHRSQSSTTPTPRTRSPASRYGAGARSRSPALRVWRGGDRDAGKRRRWARREDSPTRSCHQRQSALRSRSILVQIVADMREPSRGRIPDRADAIRHAVRGESGDVVVIAGKARGLPDHGPGAPAVQRSGVVSRHSGHL
jgi:hypothetical protein